MSKTDILTFIHSIILHYYLEHFTPPLIFCIFFEVSLCQLAMIGCRQDAHHVGTILLVVCYSIVGLHVVVHSHKWYC